MISTRLMQILLVEYVVILAVCVYERNGPRAVYWLGAAVLQMAVLWGMK